MTEGHTMLQPLLAHLFGPTLGTAIAEMARATEGERVAIVGTDATVPGDLHRQPIPGMNDETLAGHSDDLHDPFPVIEFITWNPAVGLEGLTPPWDLMIGLPPQGIKDEEALGDFLRAAGSTASARARAVFLFSETWLGREFASRGRAQLLQEGTVRGLTFTGARYGDGTRFMATRGMALVDWVPVATTLESAQITRNAGPGEGATTFQARLDPGMPWTVPLLDPERAARLGQWAEKGRAKPLSEFADVPLPELLGDREFRLLHGNQVGRLGSLFDDEDPEPHKPGMRAVPLRPGDIVGRMIGDPSLWTVVTETDLSRPVAAAEQVMVVRPKRMNSYTLLAFLRSDAATTQFQARVVGPHKRLHRRDVRDLLVPDLDLSNVGPDDPIAEFRAVAGELADSVEARYRSAFDVPTAEAVLGKLVDAHGDAAMAADLIRRVNDPIHRAKQFMPHPLARTLRVYQTHTRADSPAEAYRDLLRFSESAIVLLGAVGLAYLDSRDDTELPNEWTTKLTTSGVSLGTWLAAANTGAEAARRAGEGLGGIARALTTKSPLNDHLGFFLERRNDDSHGAGPRSPFEFEQAVSALEERLYDLIQELSPLASADWFVVEQLDWDQRASLFTVKGRSLRGEHPDFDAWTARLPLPLASRVVHVDLGPTRLSLGGLCVLRACSRCLHEELYYPDRLRGSMVRLRSLDRGHEAEMTAADLALPLPPEPAAAPRN